MHSIFRDTFMNEILLQLVFQYALHPGYFAQLCNICTICNSALQAALSALPPAPDWATFYNSPDSNLVAHSSYFCNWEIPILEILSVKQWCWWCWWWWQWRWCWEGNWGKREVAAPASGRQTLQMERTEHRKLTMMRRSLMMILYFFGKYIWSTQKSIDE